MKAGIYCRISLAVLNDTTKTDDQARQCRELCERRGWEVAGVYTDNSKSAWKKGVRRPGWDALLTAVGAGEFGAIVTYWGDRLVRQPRDLEDLLDLRETRQITLASIAGQYDFDNPDHRMMMRWEVARACNESDNISRRKINGYERMRREGRVRPGGRGGRAFGFEPGDTGIREDEAAIVRETARRILAGESRGTVARDMAARGITTTAGSPFRHSTITRTLTRPRYAGLMPDGVSPAAWPAILGRGEWEMLCAVLSAKGAAFGHATNARRHLLSGIAACGECGSPLQVNPSNGRKGRPPQVGYACRADGCRKVYRSRPLLDAYVTGRLVARLNREDNPAPEVDVTSSAGRELAALTARREETVAVIESLADHPGQRIDVLARALASFDEKIAAVRGQMAGQSGRRLLAEHAGITRAEFEGLPLDVRRSIVRASYAITVLPASRRGPGFSERDVVMSPIG